MNNQAPAGSTVSIPVTATYRIIDGRAVKVAAEYADITTDIIARLLVGAFGQEIFIRKE